VILTPYCNAFSWNVQALYCETPSIAETANRAVNLNFLSAAKGFYFLVYAFISMEIFAILLCPVTWQGTQETGTMARSLYMRQWAI